jgi:two-component system, cell cycle sensor histidine kinase and response regulator CckA
MHAPDAVRLPSAHFSLHFLFPVLLLTPAVVRAGDPLQTLTTAAEVRTLSPAEADLGHPVRLRGVVTYYEPRWSYVFVQDATSGIFVQMASAQLALHQGQLVDVEGISTRGGKTPCVVQATLTAAGQGPLPEPTNPSLARLATGVEDCQWVAATGIVRATARENDRAILSLFADRQELRVAVRPPPPDGGESLVGARVKVRGVCATVTGRNGRLQRVEVLVNGPDNLTVEKPAPEDPHSSPVTPIARLGDLPLGGTRRARVEGEVVRTADSFLEVRDSSGAVSIHPDQMLPIRVGDHVEVMAFPEANPNDHLVMVHAKVRVLAPRAAAARTAAGWLQSTDYLPLLQQLKEVRALTPAQADLGYAVRVRAVVTYYDPLWKNLFVQDATAGIYVNPPEPEADLHPGQIVNLTGFTGAGDFAPVVLATRIAPEAQGEVPQPREPTFAELTSGKEDSQWVAIAGVVRTASLDYRHLTLEVAVAGGFVTVLIPGVDESTAGDRLVDAEVRVQGACGSIFNQRRQVLGTRLCTPSLAEVTVTQPAPAEPFSLPGRKVADLLRFNPEDRTGHRVTVAGVVAYCRGKLLYLRDETGGLRVDLLEAATVEPGDRVQALGFPGVDGHTPCLQRALVRRIDKGPVPEPVRLSPSQALREEADASLVQLTGRLVDRSSRDGRQVLVLQADGCLFEARLVEPNEGLGGPALTDAEAESQLRVTGVCVVQFDERLAPRSFQLLLRGPDDVVVLSRPPWWTVRRALWLVVGIASVALAALAWVVSLRRRIRRQTALIEKRVRREAALEQRHRSLVENANDIVFTLDLAGCFTSLNRAGETLTGYPREQIAGRPLAGLVLPEQAESVAEQVAAARSARTSPPSEMTVVTRDGRYVVLEVNARLIEEEGKPLGVQGIARDITQRKQAEAARARLIAILEATPDLVAISQVEGPASYINPAGRKLLGLGRDEVAVLSDLRPDWARKVILEEAIPTAIRERTWSGETVLLNKAGEDIPVSQVLIAHRSSSGDVEFLSTIARDIRGQKQMEEQLRQGQKMEAIGRLAGGVAHDFNNLLTVITGHVTLLLDSGRLSPAVSEPLEEIHKAAERAASLTRQLLAFSRRQILRPVVLNLNAVVADTQKLLERLIGEDVVLLTDLEPALGLVKVDPGQVEQILMNLAVNARDAMPRGGELKIRTANVVLEPATIESQPDFPPGPYSLLTVSDTGCGMNEATLGHIFEPFFTTKEVGKGTGLGLATVYGIVQQSGGFIAVKSQPERGTTFNIYLPQIPSQAPPHGPASGQAKTSTGHETVLLVEDEDGVRRFAQLVLQESGYCVLAARDGPEALEIAQQHQGLIHLLVTDVIMPNMSGRELAERLTLRLPGLKTLYISGYTDDAVLRHGVSQSSPAFLPKPFTPISLAQKVRELLAEPSTRRTGC